MRPILFIALLFLTSCDKDQPAKEAETMGTVHYTIENAAVQIEAKTTGSQALWSFADNSAKGYSLVGFNSGRGGAVRDMLSFFIKTAELQTGKNYEQEVSGTILPNSGDCVASKDLPGTYIRLVVSKRSGNALTGTFTGELKDINTNKFVAVSGDFENVKLK